MLLTNKCHQKLCYARLVGRLVVVLATAGGNDDGKDTDQSLEDSDIKKGLQES